ncbi:MAG: hypothetical protein L0Y71_19340 [Gemmataceae bacterium]|nr:hypothetical protein [Gemmataceae bacterium]
MTKEECFVAWAPDGIPWSQWAKPVVFANLDRIAAGGVPDQPTTTLSVDWIPEASHERALIVDVPGAESVVLGLSLARRGYRPVPLYNGTVGPAPVIDIEPIARQLQAGAEVLHGLGILPDAPPAFLLDAARMTPKDAPGPGKFDNRWIVFPQDFPSATYLRARGINEVLLLRRGTDAPGEDLAHVLLRWQEAGIHLLGGDVAAGGPWRELRVRRPSLFRRAWYRTMAMLGLRRHDAGGFGAMIPLASAGGG